MLPPDTNHMGTIFGGTVLSYIDEIAAITAMKHSKEVVVTASIDTVNRRRKKLFQSAQRRKERRLKINEFSEEKWK